MKKPHYDEGVYGVVFFDSMGMATKVFRKRQDVDRLHVERVFASEVEAYRIAGSSAHLKELVPDFFGPTTVEGVLSSNGCDISGQFYLDLAYRMERIFGHFCKINSVAGASRENVKQWFRDAGIRHMNDASVVCEGEAILKVIDFAVEEFEVWASEQPGRWVTD